MENFALKAKTAVKRIAAVTATSVMMGATMFGAVAAADLSDYPAPFVKDGKWVGLIVVGAKAAPADIIGATDVAASLAQQATTAASGTGTTTVSGGQMKDIVLGDNIGLPNSGGFDQELDHGDIASLKDDSLTFQSTSYDYREMLVWHNATQGSAFAVGPQIATSLTSIGGVEDDYKDGIYLEANKGTIGYYYVLDSTINISKTTSSDPLALSFLGRKMKITTVTDSNTFTARVGQEAFMNVGDTITIEGKKVLLKNVGSATTNAPFIVDVDGVVETLNVNTAETVNGLEILGTDAFYSDNVNERSASIVVGKDASETYNDGDKFVQPCGVAYKRAECKKENPDWVWDVDGLDTSAAGDTITTGDTTKPSIGVINDYTVNDFSDNPPAAGGKYDLPLGGYEIRFNKLTVPDTDYMTLTVTFESSADFSADASATTPRLGASQASEPAFLIEVTEAEGIEVLKSDGAYAKTNKIWLTINDSFQTNTTDVVYRNPTDGKATWASNIGPGGTVGRVAYGETKTTNVVMLLNGNLTAGTGLDPYVANKLNLTFDIRDDNNYMLNAADDISVWLGNTAGGDFATLGASLNSEEAREVIWNYTTTLGTKDENHRSRYGIVIMDPKSNGASDRVKLKIPKDIVKAQVTVAGPDTVTSTTGGAVSVSSISGVPVAKLDSEVSDKTAYSMIVVGGPCANDLALSLSGKTAAMCAEGYTAGKAKIQLFENAFGGTKTALLVAGYGAADTRNAATVLKDFKSYSDKLKGTTVEVASAAGVITVSAPTVA
ncbi:MAG TPA: S-layer protein [Nanoarchaeota archaeon]|nr:S-layer protein [Nanoarchaeota archaeon]